MRSPSLPNRTGGSPASGFPVGRRWWAGSGDGSQTFGGNTPAAQSLRTRSPSHGRPTADRQASTRRFSTAPTRSALRHYVGPFGMVSIRLPALPSYVPSLHDHYSLRRYYGRSDPDRPVGHQSWFPDSRRSNFRAFRLQSSADLHQPRSTPFALAALLCCGLRRGYAGSPVPPTESSSLCSPCGESLLRTARSFPVALHPGVWPRSSYFPLLALQCRPGQGLSPCCSNALSGAHSPAFQRREPGLKTHQVPTGTAEPVPSPLPGQPERRPAAGFGPPKNQPC
jgi:hypothetical protein